MREPTRMEPEVFRRMLRERQGLCPECDGVVEGVDRFHQPGLCRADRPVIWCPHCSVGPVFGILLAKQRQYISVEREPGRADKELALFEGMPGSHEGRDECWYVWVDGQFEDVESMSNAKLDALLARMKSLDEDARGRIARNISEEEERIRALYVRSEPTALGASLDWTESGDEIGLQPGGGALTAEEIWAATPQQQGAMGPPAVPSEPRAPSPEPRAAESERHHGS